MSFASFNTFQSNSNFGSSSLPSNKASVTTNPSITPTSYLDPSNNLYWVYSFTSTTAPYTMTFSNVTETIPLSILAVAGGGGGDMDTEAEEEQEEWYNKLQRLVEAEV
jgi:hypothetical protein